MNRNALWTVLLVAGAWTGFLLGYAMSGQTGSKAAVVAKAETGGYGCVPKKGAATGAAAQPAGTARQ